MICDNIVLKKLGEKNAFEDTELLVRLEEKLNQKRYLDEPPKPIKLGGLSKAEKIGTFEEFKAFYNYNYDASLSGTAAKLLLSTVSKDAPDKTCDYEVFIVIKTLIMMGVTKCPDRAEAAKRLFAQVIAIPHIHITRGDVYSMVESREENSYGYYYEVLAEALVDCMCTDENKIKYHIRMCLAGVPDANKMYVLLCNKYSSLTPNEYDKMIRKDAQEVMKHTYYPKSVKSLGWSAIVGMELVNGVQTSEQVIAEFVTTQKARAALLKAYEKVDPKTMMADVQSKYVELTGKTSRSPKLMLNTVGEMLWKN